MEPGESPAGACPLPLSPRDGIPATWGMLPCTGKLPFAGISLFHANLPRTAFGRRFGNLTLTTDVGRTCLCERSGHFSY